ncbi:hypothetical protein B0F90DRAFT_1834014, partial [Multifurca ochricompacta]
IAFFKQQTRIDDDNELKAHLLSIQAEAYKVHPYTCIRLFSWTRLKISRIFPYQDLLKLGREREGAIFLDIGCCFGNDVRKAILDGFPLRNVVTSDLHQKFWDLGHKLFKSTPHTFPVAFVPGDVFDPEHLEIVPPYSADSPPVGGAPDLRTLGSLNPLHGHVTAIHASAFFHLFSKEAQLRLARGLAGLLSPEPGSMIFGQQFGLPESGLWEEPSSGHSLFCHSAQSWSELWDGEVFPRNTVKVLAYVMEIPRDKATRTYPEAQTFHLLTWSVIRL